jgi:hypothetical protein
MSQLCKRLSGCPAERLAVCRGDVAPAGDGVDFGIDGRSVRVSQDAYSIFLAREQMGKDRVAALQQRLNIADQRVCDLTVERNRLKERRMDLLQDVLDAKEVMRVIGVDQARFSKMFKAFASHAGALQSDLTKARELLRRMTTDYACCLEAGHERITGLGGDCDSVEKMLDDNRDYAEARAFLATPIACNVDEICGQDAEAAKGGA